MSPRGQSSGCCAVWGDRPVEDIVAVTDISDDGYTFWYCSMVDDWTLMHIYDEDATGVGCMRDMEFEMLEVPAGAYAVFRTGRERYPSEAYEKLCECIAGEWIAGSGHVLRDAPEFAVYHWYRNEQRDYMEIWLPVEG